RHAGQWPPVGEPHDLGRWRPCPGRLVHEDAGRSLVQPRTQQVLGAPAHRWPGGEGRTDGRQAQAVDDPDRHGHTSHTLASAGGAERITDTTPLTIKTVAPLLPRYGY